MYIIEPLQKQNAETIAGWCRDQDEAFLYQWAVGDYRYPLTGDQILTRLNEGARIFQAVQNGVLTATIELLSFCGDRGMAGKFIVDPSQTAKGTGSAVMKAFQQYVKENFRLKELSIRAFDFNQPALHCYKKCGFQPVNTEKCKNGMTAVCLTVKL